jgi:AAA family ATP:ADP antiporter
MKPNAPFSLLKAIRSLWPVENHEFKKFFPMAFMFGCVLFNYTMLRSIKDSLVVTHLGAEAISFIKLYMTFPIAILFAIIYAKMTNLMSQKQIFYSFCSLFLAFFMIFAFIIYPNQDFFHPSPEPIMALSEKSVSIFGLYDLHLSHFKWFFKIFTKWSFGLFYVFCELWGSMMLSLLFWQFANSITKTDEAKRFYPMIGLLGNIGLLASGLMLIFLSSNTGGGGDMFGDDAKLAVSAANEGFLISSVTWAVSATIVTLIGLYMYMNNVVLADPRFMPASVAKKREKLEMSMLDGFKVVFSSKYLGLIAILLLCYGVSINLVEGPWKHSVKQVYTDTVSYTGFMGHLQLYTGIFTMLAFFISAQILKRISWFSGAILTPIMIAVSGVGFFMFLVLKNTVASGGLGMFLTAFDPLYLAVIFGLMQNVASKATKYSFFDPTKEMSYIPIDVELQTKGKAAVDIVAARLSKSFGGLLQSTIFIIFPAVGFTEVAPYFMIVFIVICLIWLIDVKLLYNEYKKLIK